MTPVRRFLRELAIVTCLTTGVGLVALAVVAATGGLAFRPVGGVVLLKDGTRIEADSPEEIQRITRENAGHISKVELVTDDRVVKQIVRVALLPAFVALTVYVVAAERRKLQAWLRVRPKNIALGLAAGAAMIGLGALYEVALGFAEHQAGDPSVQQRVITLLAEQRVLLLLVGVVVAPIAEEVYFRGRFFDGVSSRWGTAAAVIVTSLVFGAVHLNLALLPVYVLFGAILAGTRIFTGGLVAPIIAHALNNAVSILLETTQRGGAS